MKKHCKTLANSKLIVCAACWLILACGCAPRTAKTTGLVRPECLTAPIQLQGCDWSQDPPRCQKIKISIKRGCAELQVERGTKKP